MHLLWIQSDVHKLETDWLTEVKVMNERIQKEAHNVIHYILVFTYCLLAAHHAYAMNINCCHRNSLKVRT